MPHGSTVVVADRNAAPGARAIILMGLFAACLAPPLLAEDSDLVDDDSPAVDGVVRTSELMVVR